GSGGCGSSGSSTRSAGWRPRACGRGPRPVAPSAMPRCWRSWPASAASRRRRTRPCELRAASPAASMRGSARTSASPGCHSTPPTSWSRRWLTIVDRDRRRAAGTDRSRAMRTKGTRTSMATSISFVKGHGTQNDFVLVPDADDVLRETLDAATVRRMTDRYAGIGADGVIRVVPTDAVPDYAHLADAAEWFMDYRNADGSVAEMCGNGVWGMARYLWESGYAEGPVLTIATRGGARTVHAETDETFTVEMGHARPAPTRQLPLVTAAGHTWPATAVWVPNPHAVVFVDDLAALGLLTEPPGIRPATLFPESANVEFVVGHGERHIAMRSEEHTSE